MEKIPAIKGRKRNDKYSKIRRKDRFLHKRKEERIVKDIMGDDYEPERN